jgi:hypothetical protein
MNVKMSAACALALVSPVCAEIRLPAVLGSHMVLQQNTEARLWGWGRPGEKVLISTSWSTVPTDAVVDDKGSWRAEVKTPAADGKPQTISFKGDNEVVLNDILIGEVWVCSGQSNMEWPFRASANWEEELKATDQPRIRLFTVENTVSAEAREDCKGSWAAARPETVKNFSAVGYYFAAHVRQSVDVPIGVISSDWGGTPAEAWTSETILRTMPEWADALKTVAKLRGDSGALKRDYDVALAAWMKHFDEVEPGSHGEVWFAPGLDDSTWKSMEQPNVWEGEIGTVDGTVWFRRTVEIPMEWGGKPLTLELGPIDDHDTTWFNGHKVGEKMGEGTHATRRVYTVPSDVVRPGKAVIAIRILDTGGAGGMSGTPDQLKLGPQEASMMPLSGPWKYKVGLERSKLPARPRPAGIGPNTPTSLYNGMIAPLTPLSIRGVIWYQGESNRGRAFQYRTLFPAMIKDWRARWAMPDNAEFPFYFVQIAPFAYGGDKGEAAELREAQVLTSALLNTGMAVTMDIGNPADIHPTNKKEVGRRLALWALARTYSKGVECSGPTMKSFTVAGGTVTITFDHAEGLTSGGQDLTCFTIAGEDRKFVPAMAVIDGKSVLVSADGIKAPVAVRYGWGAADEPNLRNGAGLPASSFRTDDWPGLMPTPAKQSRLDVLDHTLVLAAPIDRWDEALQLGNGLLGGLLWGSGNTIRLSLDRGDLWDLHVPEAFKDSRWNYADMQKMVAARDEKTFHELFDVPYDTVPHPTKLPGGRIELALPVGLSAGEFRLDLRRAEASVAIGGGPGGGQAYVRAFFSAVESVAMVRVTGVEWPESKDPRAQGVEPPRFDFVRAKGVEKLGYVHDIGVGPRRSLFLTTRYEPNMAIGPPAKVDLRYSVMVEMRRDAGGLTYAITVDRSRDLSHLTAMSERLGAALDRGYDEVFRPHAEWWERFWATSSVDVPDATVQGHYDLCKYLYGAASRKGAPPMPLQGVWTADEGGLPPWKGDYHNDLNTQMTYLAYLTAGLFECGESWLDFNWNLLPRYREFAKSFYGVDGAVVPGVMAIDGSPLGGWGMYSLSPTNGLWVAQAFDLHWKYTGDEKFLRERAYPFCSEVVGAVKAMMKPDDHGKLKLPLSSSPEIHDNSYRAWLKPHSNYDQALIDWGWHACLDMALEQKASGQASGWGEFGQQVSEKLDTDNGGALTFAKGEPYAQSHRHFSHAMAIHPLGLLTIEGSTEDRATIDATLDSIHRHGTSAWCGYSFGWFSCMLARCGRPEMALDYLERYHRGFILRNGFHCNGDQSGTGMSNFTYRPFTLEGNFLAMQAVHEMLLQSWGGTVRIFPAVSERWREASFEGLRAEGGFAVSAQRRGGKTTEVSIEASTSGPLRVRDPFFGRGQWSRPGQANGGCLEFVMHPGDVLVGRATDGDRPQQ